MAIFFKENQNKGTLIVVIIGSISLIVIAFLAYYLFFSPAVTTEIIKSENYERASLFADARLDVDAVLNLPAWRVLEQESPVKPLITEVTSKKENLFQQFRN